MKVSVFTSIHNRARLLKYSLESIMRQLPLGSQVELNVADSGSTDNLDEVLADFSNQGPRVVKYDTSGYKAHFNNEHGCPAARYNALAAVSSHPYIIKVDPEFIFITDGFIKKAVDILEQGSPSIIMPLPHHVREFEWSSLDGIRQGWRPHEYSTHINRETAPYVNVYYGCVFSRQAYIDLGGIDLRFGQGIGSEDDHMLDQWRRKYGSENVLTLLDEEGLHMWHGGFSAGVPSELYHHVNKNADLRRALEFTFPNDGNFNSVEYPDLPYVEWRDGQVAGEGIKKVPREGEADNGFVIGYVDR
jgi:glycosyltransferase involved in cell wall biosynthesis